LRDPIGAEEAVEHPDRREVARLGAGPEPPLPQPRQVAPDVVRLDRVDVGDAGAVQIVEVVAKILAVGVDGARTEAALDPNVAEEEIEERIEGTEGRRADARAGHAPTLAAPRWRRRFRAVDQTRPSTGPLPSRRTSTRSSRRESTVEGSLSW